MHWFKYTYRRGRIAREIIRPMTAAQAEKLGAELVPDFDPSEQVAGIVVASFPPEGQLESTYPIEAEAPVGRF
jgi:hypothetical protein